MGELDIELASAAALYAETNAAVLAQTESSPAMANLLSALF